jgi:hypothetical protein
MQRKARGQIEASEWSPCPPAICRVGLQKFASAMWDSSAGFSQILPTTAMITSIVITQIARLMTIAMQLETKETQNRYTSTFGCDYN